MKKRSSFILLITCLFQMGIVNVLLAQKVFVKSGVSGGLSDGTSWENAYNDLQVALYASNPGDSIFVSQGVYDPDTSAANTNRNASFIIKDGMYVKGGFPSTSSGVSTTGSDYEEYGTFLNGDIGTATNHSDNIYHLLTSVNSSGFGLEAFSLVWGNAKADTNSTGGAWLNISPTEKSTFNFKNCTIVYHSATSGGAFAISSSQDSVMMNLENVTIGADTSTTNGGAIYAEATSGSLFINGANGSFISNTSGGNGGGIFSKGSGGSIILDFNGTSFFNNSAADGGGGLYIESLSDSVNLSLSKLFIAGNSSVNGGGIYNSNVSGLRADLRFNETSFSNNKATGNGGSIYNYSNNTGSQSDLIIDRGYFNGDTASVNGGFIHNMAAGAGIANLNVTNTHFIKGLALSNGGVLYNQAEASSSATVTMVGTSLNQNSAGVNGGALYLTACGLGNIKPTIRSSTFRKDSAGTNGGAIFIKKDVTDMVEGVIVNTIFWINRANTGSGEEFYLQNSSINISYSHVEAVDCAALDVGTAAHGVVCSGTMLYNSDPKLAVGDIPFPTACSPGINQGQSVPATENDYFGTARPYPGSAGVDIGAFEFPGLFDNSNSLTLTEDFNEGIHLRYGNPSVTLSGEMKSGSNVGVGANNSIMLEQGFETVSGSVFTAGIDVICP